MITAWRIPPKSLSSFSVSGHHPTWICGLKKVNIFIGRNNSGKSRVLRSLFSSFENNFICEKLTLDETGYDLINRDPSIREKIIGTIAISQDIRVDAGSRSEIKELKNTQEDLQKRLNDKGYFPFEEIISFYFCCVNVARIVNELTGDIRDSANGIASRIGTGSLEDVSKFTDCLGRLSGSDLYDLPKIYIPVLRSAKLSGLGADRSSEDQIIKHHFSDTERRAELREYIFTGQSFYGDILDLNGGGSPKAQKARGV